MIQIAKSTSFGNTRILGELRKLGMKKVSRQTVRNILNEEGIQQSPNLTSDSWQNFIDRHAKTLWAFDFFSVRTVTAKGLQELYVMVWLCMATRERIVSSSTAHLNSAWVAEQTKELLEQKSCRDEKPAIVMHDRDTKFTQEFVDKLKSKGVQHNALPKASPNLNGSCERVIFTIKNECLQKFIIFGKRHLDHMTSEFTGYRSHTETEHLPPLALAPEEVLTIERDELVVRSYVGGLVRSFERKAA